MISKVSSLFSQHVDHSFTGMHSTFANQIASSSEHSNVLTLAICFESKTNGPTTFLVRENVWGTKRHGFVVMSDLRIPHATLVLGIDCVVLCYPRSPQSAPRCTQSKAQLLWCQHWTQLRSISWQPAQKPILQVTQLQQSFKVTRAESAAGTVLSHSYC